jgi:Ca2+-binding EF-hand superfamily protein
MPSTPGSRKWLKLQARCSGLGRALRLVTRHKPRLERETTMSSQPLTKTLSLLVLAASTVLAVGCSGTIVGDDDASEEQLLQTTEGLSAESDGADPVEDGVVTDADADEASDDAAEDGTADAVEPPDLGCGVRKALRIRIKNHFDTNGDGKLDKNERSELKDALGNHPRMKVALLKMGIRARHHVWKRIVWAFDADGDGALDTDERQALSSAVQARCEARKARILDKFDANDDGELDDAEIKVAIQTHMQNRRERLRELFKAVDVNDNHRLDEAERAAARAALKAYYLAKRDAIKAKFDANNDGKLDDAEIAALKAAIRARFAGESPAE